AYGGELLFFPKAALGLIEAARAVLATTLPPRESLAGLENSAFLQHLERSRRVLADDKRVLRALRALVATLHGLEETVFDPPRLRVILPRGHHLAAAAPVYFAHRDTWYANPRCQLNWWTPFHRVETHQTFVFYPEAFETPVPNDSQRFDYERWRTEVGFANSNPVPEAVYPRALGSLAQLQRKGVEADAGDLLVFSAAHLHQTLPLEDGPPRLSIDFRTVYYPDHQAGRGAPDPDNHSRGSTLGEYLK
ncbi:MAG: hypothetical protein KC910_19610, partial [Candidatus Eremiobacteraeota bacterium]|nr:hypothetical protein [Candidatus Eremiobacteraeota bacterium]